MPGESQGRAVCLETSPTPTVDSVRLRQSSNSSPGLYGCDFDRSIPDVSSVNQWGIGCQSFKCQYAPAEDCGAKFLSCQQSPRSRKPACVFTQSAQNHTWIAPFQIAVALQQCVHYSRSSEGSPTEANRPASVESRQLGGSYSSKV